MGYELQNLLTIRVRREDRARGELTAARQAVAQAVNELEDRKKTLREFELTKESRRDRIYDAIIGQTVSADDLELAREGVARIDEEGVLKADNVLRAEEELKRKEEDAETARMKFIESAKNRMKITEHKSEWQKAETKEVEHKLEIELEDFTGKKALDDRDN